MKMLSKERTQEYSLHLKKEIYKNLQLTYLVVKEQTSAQWGQKQELDVALSESTLEEGLHHDRVAAFWVQSLLGLNDLADKWQLQILWHSS